MASETAPVVTGESYDRPEELTVLSGSARAAVVWSNCSGKLAAGQSHPEMTTNH